jgi:hypothetical protein
LDAGAFQSVLCSLVADRHYFQSGAVGGVTSEEFLQGSTEVKEFVESEPHRTSMIVPFASNASRRKFLYASVILINFNLKYATI